MNLNIAMIALITELLYLYANFTTPFISVKKRLRFFGQIILHTNNLVKTLLILRLA